MPARISTLNAVASPVAQPFAFHYGMPEIDALYGQGKVAVVSGGVAPPGGAVGMSGDAPPGFVLEVMMSRA